MWHLHPIISQEPNSGKRHRRLAELRTSWAVLGRDRSAGEAPGLLDTGGADVLVEVVPSEDEESAVLGYAYASAFRTRPAYRWLVDSRDEHTGERLDNLDHHRQHDEDRKYLDQVNSCPLLRFAFATSPSLGVSQMDG